MQPFQYVESSTHQQDGPGGLEIPHQNSAQDQHTVTAALRNDSIFVLQGVVQLLQMCV